MWKIPPPFTGDCSIVCYATAWSSCQVSVGLSWCDPNENTLLIKTKTRRMFPCELTGVTVHLRVDDADFAVLLCFFSRLGRPRAGHDVVGASVLFEPNQVERNGAELSGPPTLQEQHLIVVWDVSGEEHVRLLGESFRISRAATKVTYNNSRRRLSVLLMILLKSEER